MVTFINYPDLSVSEMNWFLLVCILGRFLTLAFKEVVVKEDDEVNYREFYHSSVIKCKIFCQENLERIEINVT